jgi:sulfoacetaldehyde dehydrogenase
MKTFAILFSSHMVQIVNVSLGEEVTFQSGCDRVDHLVNLARQAQAEFESGGNQARYDKAAKAAAWALMEPGRNAQLAQLAVQSTGLGNVADKIIKNHRKTLGLMRDIEGVATFGVLSDDPETGITEIARPLGVIGAVVPSTNPAATPANNVINALKCGNAIILSPSPKGVACCALLVEFIHAEFDKIGENKALVQMVPPPGSKAETQRLLELVDLAVVTGSQDNVRRAYSSGTPAIGVGAGNVTVIVDETADLTSAAQKIAASKTFDNATSCSSENALVVVDAVYEAFVAALHAEGGALVPHAESAGIVAALWPDGHLNRAVIAKDADVLLKALGLIDKVPATTRFVAVETDGIGPDHPLSGEKLSRVVALYRARDYEHAVEITRQVLMYQGAGHSLGLHSTDSARPLALGAQMPTCRVIVNQAHCFATGGAFDNGLPFSLSMGCGSWGGNSIDDNLHWRHFTQRTKVVRQIPAREPTLDAVFGQYWSEVGR